MQTKEQNTKVLPSENMKNMNAKQQASYYKRKFEAKHKHQEMNMEKETSFPDAQKTNGFGQPIPLDGTKFQLI